MFRTLLVEDNTTFRKTLHSMLEEQFPLVEVLEAGDGRAAMGSITAQRPDMVFMDIKLPDESGLELACRIKTHDPSIVVIILSSHDLPEYRQAAYRNGASCYLCKKNIEPDDIIAIIQGTMSYGIWY
ncbi:MAG TPA: response regulator transcription factor [Gammaproteobacteria bacterium]